MTKSVLSLVLWCVFFFGMGNAAHAEECEMRSGRLDCRDDFSVTGFIGYAIDTFASSDVNRTINPGDANSQKERRIGGLDLTFLFAQNNWVGLWLRTEAMYAKSSVEVNCDKEPQAEGCSGSTGNQIIYLMRNASTFDGLFGPRISLPILSSDHWEPYVTYNRGIHAVAGLDSFIETFHWGLGVSVLSEQFAHSYIELGFGRNEFFEDPGQRFKFDALISWTKEISSYIVYPFIEITVDTDLDKGPDSLQTYFGIDIALEELFEFQKMFIPSDS